MNPAKLLLVVLVAAACSAPTVSLDATLALSDAAPEVATQADVSDAGGAQLCTAGRVEECPCGDGRRGVQTCQPSGSYGPCVCADAVVVGPDVVTPPVDVPEFLDATAGDAVTVTDAEPADAQRADAGCDAATSSDPANCGACGAVCPARANAIQGCVSGHCALSCLPGFGDCNGVAMDGCEADFGRTLAHCGGCGMACVHTGATSQCLAGTCLLGSCIAPSMNCDGIPANGCETNLNTNNANCGRCGNQCNFPNASPTCTSGTCGIGSCITGFANCNNTPTDGCEVDTRSNPTNCGNCGTRCPTGQMCLSGNCFLICPDGQRACGGRCVDADAGC